jgi:hypothetical protein
MQTLKNKKSLQANAQGQCKLDTTDLRPNKATSGNNGFKKLAVQWLIEHLCFVSSALLADSFRLRNRQLLVAAKRQAVKKLTFLSF